MKKTIITILVAGSAAILGGMLFGIAPKDTFLFIVSMFGA